MRDYTSIQKEFYNFIDESRTAGISDSSNYLYLFLYFFSCCGEGIDLKLKIEKRPVFDDNNLFGKEEGKLDLYNDHFRFELNNVPQGKRIFFEINKVFNGFLANNHTANFIQKYLQSDPIERLSELIHNEGYVIEFENLLEIIQQKVRKKSGEFTIPLGLGSFMVELANLPDKAYVFNPFSGLATFGISLKNDQKYLGHEINDLIWAVSVLRINAHSRASNSDLLYTDSFDNWPSNRKFDLVIANPPFRLKLSKGQQSKFSGERYVENFFIKEGEKLLNHSGKLLTIVPHGFLTSHSEKELRRYLVDQDLLEAVISFPGGILKNTNISFVILVVNKNKRRKNKTILFDASKFVNVESGYSKIFDAEDLILEIRRILEQKEGQVNEPKEPYGSDITLYKYIADKDKIASNDYSFNLKRYSLEDIKGTPLKHVIDPEKTISFNKAINYFENPDEISSSQKMAFKHLSTKDLKNDPKDYYINISTIEYKDVKYGKFINSSCYLVSLIGNNLKPSFLNIKNEVVHLSNDIVAFTLNEDLVDPDWFVKELNSTKVKEQQEALISGKIPRLRKTDFLNLKIHLPSLKEQRNEMSKILGLEKKLDDLESDIIQQNSYLRHTVAGPLSDLDHALKNIENIVQNISQDRMPNIMETKVSENHLYTLGEYLQDSKNYVSFILNTVKSKLNSSQKIEQKSLIKFNLRKHLDKYRKRKSETKKELKYDIDFDYDRDFFNAKDNAHFDYILGNKDLIDTLLDNMIDNAVKHAFREDESNKIKIYVWGYDDEVGKESIYFSISNTGKPMPEDVNLDMLKKRGYSKGDESGEGFGLWLVNEIVKKHNAEWYMVDNHRIYNSSETEYTIIKGVKIPITKLDTVTNFTFHFPILKK